MRKCEKCGANMKQDLRLKVNGGGYGIVVRVDEKHKATTIDDVRVAVCPECGYTEMYLQQSSEIMHLNPVHQSVKSASDIFAVRQHACRYLPCLLHSAELS